MGKRKRSRKPPALASETDSDADAPAPKRAAGLSSLSRLSSVWAPSAVGASSSPAAPPIASTSRGPEGVLAVGASPPLRRVGSADTAADSDDEVSDSDGEDVTMVSAPATDATSPGPPSPQRAPLPASSPERKPFFALASPQRDVKPVVPGPSPPRDVKPVLPPSPVKPVISASPVDVKPALPASPEVKPAIPASPDVKPVVPASPDEAAKRAAIAAKRAAAQQLVRPRSASAR